jgi:hypothetical protein
VDGLERELEGRARVVRLSAFSKVGQEVAQRYAVRGVPTFLIFDGQGELGFSRKIILPMLSHEAG